MYAFACSAAAAVGAKKETQKLHNVFYSFASLFSPPLSLFCMRNSILFYDVYCACFLPSSMPAKNLFCFLWFHSDFKSNFDMRSEYR